MNLKNTLKILGIILVFVVLQSYFTNPERFVAIIENWKDYFMTIIMSIFIAILLEPIVKYLKKKSKINDILAISLSIIFVILVFIILSLIVIPEIISSLKVLNDIYPYISEKAITIGKNIANYLAEKNIYTINMDEVNNYFTNFISSNTTNITKLASSLLGSLVDWTIGFTNLFLAFVLAFLILLDKKHLIKTLENIIKIIFGVKNTPYIMNKLSLSKNIFLGYVSGKIIVSAIVGLCVYVILLITGTPYAAFENIKEVDTFFVKGSEFTLEEFFNDKELAKKYEDGTFVIIRLAPADYHRFHFPVDGEISEVKKISGDYYSVSTHAIKTNFRIFCENKREYAILKTKKFGDIAMFDIGATMVGAIVQTYKANSFVKKGEEKGYFLFGGSTCILIFEKGKVIIDKDIIENTQNKIETRIYMGEKFGNEKN